MDMKIPKSEVLLTWRTPVTIKLSIQDIVIVDPHKESIHYIALQHIAPTTHI